MSLRRNQTKTFNSLKTKIISEFKAKTWPTLPPPPPTTTTIPSSLFDLDTDTPSDSASLLFLTNPNLIPDDDVELEQQNKDESTLSDEDVNEDFNPRVKSRNRLLQVNNITLLILAYH